MLQLRPYAIRVMARSAGMEPLALLAPIRDAIEGVNPDIPLFEVATLYDAIYSEKKVLDALGALFFVFGIGALALTMIGVYGIVSFSVTSRTREIGVRIALGASRAEIVRLVLRQGGSLVALGTAVGLAIAVALSHVLAAVTEFLTPAGVTTYLAIALALTATAAAGLVRPVRRALLLQPMEALRSD
jgi:ABC-type antimicrobial peptide transport system permease subunit